VENDLVDGDERSGARDPRTLRSTLPWVFALVALAATISILAYPRKLQPDALSIFLWCLVTLLVAAAAAALCSAPTLIEERPSFLGIGMPMVFGLFYGLGTIAWALPKWIPPEVRATIGPTSVVTALRLCIVGIIVWSAGWLAAAEWRPRAARGLIRLAGFHERRELTLTRIMAVYALGLLARAYQILTGSFGYIIQDLHRATSQASGLSSIIIRFELCTVVAIVLLILYQAENGATSASRWFLRCALGIEIGSAMLSGNKLGLFIRLITIIFSWRIVRGKLPRRLVVLSVILTIPFLTFIQAYRVQVRGTSGTSVSTSGAIGVLISTAGSVVDKFSIGDLGGELERFTFERFRGIDGVAVVIERTPAGIPYGSKLDTVSSALTSGVPRFLWPGKPLNIAGLQFSRVYFRQDYEIFSAQSPTIIGDLFMTGGWLPVVAGMFLHGLVCRGLSRGLPIGLNHRYAALFLPLATEMFFIETRITFLPTVLFQTALVAALACRIAQAPRVEDADVDVIEDGTISTDSSQAVR
jgi:hypothetical protein